MQITVVHRQHQALLVPKVISVGNSFQIQQHPSAVDRFGSSLDFSQFDRLALVVFHMWMGRVVKMSVWKVVVVHGDGNGWNGQPVEAPH